MEGMEVMARNWQEWPRIDTMIQRMEDRRREWVTHRCLSFTSAIFYKFLVQCSKTEDELFLQPSVAVSSSSVRECTAFELRSWRLPATHAPDFCAIPERTVSKVVVKPFVAFPPICPFFSLRPVTAIVHLFPLMSRLSSLPFFRLFGHAPLN